MRLLLAFALLAALGFGVWMFMAPVKPAAPLGGPSDETPTTWSGDQSPESATETGTATLDDVLGKSSEMSQEQTPAELAKILDMTLSGDVAADKAAILSTIERLQEKHKTVFAEYKRLGAKEFRKERVASAEETNLKKRKDALMAKIQAAKKLLDTLKPK